MVEPRQFVERCGRDRHESPADSPRWGHDRWLTNGAGLTAASREREQSSEAFLGCWIGLPPALSPRAGHRWILPTFQKSTGAGSPIARDWAFSDCVAPPGQAAVAVETTVRLPGLQPRRRLQTPGTRRARRPRAPRSSDRPRCLTVASAQDRASSPKMVDVWFAMKACATLAAITDACSRVGGERSVGCAFGWD